MFKMPAQTCLIFTLTCASLACASAFAQQASPQQAPPTTAPDPQLQSYRQMRAGILMDDFAELGRYRASSSMLASSTKVPGRVVFFGDSITDAWKLAASFPDKPYINRGIAAQTTSQMLVRFRQDVIDLGPEAVVILAGTNDIAGNTGPISNEDIEANYASIAELAHQHGIRVVFSSILPVHSYGPDGEHRLEGRPPLRITTLNSWLKAYCDANHSVYLDYYSAMLDAHRLLKQELSADGLHPNPAGYAVMAPLAEAAIQKALLSQP